MKTTLTFQFCLLAVLSISSFNPSLSYSSELSPMSPDSTREFERQEATLNAYRVKETQRLTEKINQSCETVIRENSLRLSSDKRPIHVVHVRGFVFDITAVNDPFGGTIIVRNLVNLAKSVGIPAAGFTTHRYGAQEACQQLLETPNDTRLFLVGHSMGAAGATSIANCLEKNGRSVEVLVHVSSYDTFEPTVDVTKVPANVKSAYNFSVTDGYIDGHRNVSAINPEKTQIHNSRHLMNLLIPFAGTHAYATSRLAGLISFLGGTKVLYPELEANVSIALPPLFETNWSSHVQCRLRSSENRQSKVPWNVYPTMSHN